MVRAKTVKQQTRCLHRWKTKNNHATTCCLHRWYPQTQTRKKHATKRCLHQWYTKQSCNTLPSPVVHARQSYNNTLSSPAAHAKSVTQQHAAFTGGTHKTVTQQHVAFTSGTRKNSHATTRCLHRWKTQIVTQRYVDLTRGHATTACCPHRRYSKKTAPKQQVAFTSGNTITAMQQHVAFTGGIPKQRPRNCLNRRYGARNATQQQIA